MLYESKVSFTKIVKGNDKVMKEKYMVAEAESFGDAETQTYEFCDGETDLDVIDVKRSKVREIINTRTDENDVIFVADIADTQINEEGEEVELIYKWALFANDFDQAYKRVNEYLKQGYNMQAVGMKKTKFVDVIS
jgi:hypothetical protein